MVMIIIIVMMLVMIMRMIIITKKKNDENYLKLNWRLDGKKRSDRKQPFHLISFSLMSQNTSTEAKYVHLNLGVPTNNLYESCANPTAKKGLKPKFKSVYIPESPPTRRKTLATENNLDHSAHCLLFSVTQNDFF